MVKRKWNWGKGDELTFSERDTARRARFNYDAHETRYMMNRALDRGRYYDILSRSRPIARQLRNNIRRDTPDQVRPLRDYERATYTIRKFTAQKGHKFLQARRQLHAERAATNTAAQLALNRVATEAGVSLPELVSSVVQFLPK